MTKLTDPTTPVKNGISLFGFCLLIIVLFDSNRTHIKMEDNFCQLLIDKNHSELETLVNNFLDKPDTSQNSTRKLENLKAWIKTHDCVIKVEDDPILIATEPAVKEYSIYLQGIPKPFSLGIRLAPDRWRYDIKLQN